MKFIILLASLLIIWAPGCVAYVQHPDEVQVQVEQPSTVVRIVHTRPVVRHVQVRRVVRRVHVQRTRPVVRRVHRHSRSCQHTARSTHQHRRARPNHRRHRRPRR